MLGVKCFDEGLKVTIASGGLRRVRDRQLVQFAQIASVNQALEADFIPLEPLAREVVYCRTAQVPKNTGCRSKVQGRGARQYAVP